MWLDLDDNSSIKNLIKRGEFKMAKIIFEDGERFEFDDDGDDGYGLVLQGCFCLLIIDKGGRTGYKIKKQSFIPKDAVPIPTITTRLPCEVESAFKAVQIANEML